MGFFPIDFKKIFIICILITIPMIAINIQRNEGELSFFLKPFFITASFIQSSVSNYSDSVQKTTSLYLNLIDIKKNNREMLVKMNALESELLTLKSLELENIRLSELLEFKKVSPHKLLAARVIGHDLLGQHTTLFIDKGSKDGIQPGQAVITPKGVIGSILNTEEDFSQVLTLTDTYSAIDAVVERSQARGIVEGASPSICKLKYLQRTDDVQAGDLIITTGLDGVFPKGFPIGTVTKVEKKDYGISQEVQIKPLVSTFDSEAVFVVLKTNDIQTVEAKMKELSLKD